MASGYNRRIDLFINGKQVSNDARSIRAKITRLANEQVIREKDETGRFHPFTKTN